MALVLKTCCTGVTKVSFEHGHHYNFVNNISYKWLLNFFKRYRLLFKLYNSVTIILTKSHFKPHLPPIFCKKTLDISLSVKFYYLKIFYFYSILYAIPNFGNELSYSTFKNTPKLKETTVE